MWTHGYSPSRNHVGSHQQCMLLTSALDTNLDERPILAIGGVIPPGPVQMNS